MALPKRELGDDFNAVCSAVLAGSSVLVKGDAGEVKEFARAVYEEFVVQLDAAITIYKGSGKQFYQTIAFQLKIPTEDEKGKPLTTNALKEEILENCHSDTLLVFPEAQRLTVGIRYWLSDLIGEGVRIACFTTANLKRDFFSELLEFKLKSIRAFEKKEGKLEEGQYIVIMPVFRSILLAFLVVQLTALMNLNKAVSVIGGICYVTRTLLLQFEKAHSGRKN